MEDEKHPNKVDRLSDILNLDNFTLIFTGVLTNPEDIYRKGAILNFTPGGVEHDIELDLTDSILIINLDKEDDWFMFLKVDNIDYIKHTVIRHRTGVVYNEHHVHFNNKNTSTILKDNQLELVYARLRELGRYDILMKCEG